jgi:phenylpropionate dioxygenase-like ring-hydroxylating dioxygenase large terminal subunit
MKIFFLNIVIVFDVNSFIIKKINNFDFKLSNNIDFYNFGLHPRLEEPNIDGELTWYGIGVPSDFDKQKKIKIRDINYIIWKDNNEYYGLRDACSHQGSSFEHGCILKNTITCPYHGYKYNDIGELVDIPQYKFKNNNKFNINAHKVIEKNGIVYMNTVNNLDDINSDLIWIEPEANNNNYKAVMLSEEFEHNAKLVSVNSLDICHIGFVHTFGNNKNPNPVKNSQIEKIYDSKHHYKISYDYLAGEKSIVNKIYKFNKITVENEYILPHTTVARVLFRNFSSTIITIALPISKFKTKLLVKAYRNYWYYDINNVFFLLKPFFSLINMIGDIFTYHTMYTTLKQDKLIVDNIDKNDYTSMHGNFSIKYDMMSNHYKHNYKKYYELDKYNL